MHYPKLGTHPALARSIMRSTYDRFDRIKTRVSVDSPNALHAKLIELSAQRDMLAIKASLMSKGFVPALQTVPAACWSLVPGRRIWPINPNDALFAR